MIALEYEVVSPAEPSATVYAPMAFAPDFIDRLEAASKKGEDIWQSVTDAGIVAQDALDGGRWVIGDLALLVKKSYGSDMIGQFAEAINVPVERVKEYRTVCKFWERSARADYLQLSNVTYSHMRLAMSLKDYDKAVEFIEDCAMKGWKYEAAAMEAKKRKGGDPAPAKVADFIAPLESVGGGRLVFATGAIPLEGLHPERRYRVVIREILDAED